MSVPAYRRSTSNFEVFHKLSQLREEMTNIVINNFGYNPERVKRKFLKNFNVGSLDDLSPTQRKYIEDKFQRIDHFANIFIPKEQDILINWLRELNLQVYLANSIYPTSKIELDERRLRQEIAIGYCYGIVQEFQYTIKVLFGDVEKYTDCAKTMQELVKLLIGWKKSNKRFKIAVETSDKTPIVDTEPTLDTEDISKHT